MAVGFFQREGQSKRSWKRLGDTRPSESVQLIREDDGTNFDLSSGVGHIQVVKPDGTNLISGQPLDLASGSGKAFYHWGPGQLITEDTYSLIFRIDPNNNGNFLSIPEQPYQYTLTVGAVGAQSFGSGSSAGAHTHRHSDLSDMPSAANTDHDSRYFTQGEVTLAISTHAALPSVHHPQSHTVASHSDTTATGSQLNLLISSGTNVDSLHTHNHNALEGYVANEHIDWTVATQNLLTSGTASASKYICTAEDGLEFDTLETRWAFKYASGLGLDDTGLCFHTETNAIEFRVFDTPVWSVDILGVTTTTNSIMLGKSIFRYNLGLELGDGTDDTDRGIEWDNASADCELKFDSTGTVALRSTQPLKTDAGIIYLNNRAFTEAQATTLTGGSTADSLHIHSGVAVAMKNIVNLRPGDFIVNHDANFAPAETLTGSNLSRMAHSFDYSTQEYLRHELVVPSDVDASGNVTFAYIWRPRTHPSPAQDVVWEVESVAIADGESWDTALASKGTIISSSKVTSNQMTVATQIISVSSMGWAANDTVVLRFSRDSSNPDDTLDDNADSNDDALLYGIRIEIARA